MDEQYETKIKDVLDYEIGGKRGFRADCFISSEPLNSSVDYVYVDDFKNGKRYFQGPQKRKYFGQIPNYKPEESEPLVEEKKKETEQKKRKVGTGGKIAYAKVYTSRIKAIPRKKLSFEMIGVCLCLTSLIEWETGFLIVGRGKRQRYATKEDLVKELEISLSTVKRYIKKLCEAGVLEVKDNKFRLNAKFIAKGRAFDAN